MTAELLVNSINNLDKNINTFSQQFEQPYKYYTPKFDFYQANGIIFDEKGKIKSASYDNKGKLAKIDLQNRIRAQVINLIDFWQRTIHPLWIQAIKDYVLSTVDRGLALKAKKMDFLTNEKQPIIRTFVDRVITGLFTGTYGVKVYAQNERKLKKTKLIQHFIEWAFSASNFKKTIIDSAVDATTMGTGFYRVGFKPSKEAVRSKKDTEDTIYNVDDVYANSNWESPFNIFGEPHRDFYDQPIVYRNFFPLRTIMKDKKDFFRLSKDQMAIILASPQPFSWINFNKVRLVKYYEQMLLCDTIGFKEQDLYQVRLNNDLCEYVEYRDGKNLVICINGYIVYDYINPLETGRHPFKVINYTRSPGVWIGDGVGTILASTQKLYDALFNIMFDLAKFTAGPMFLLKPGQFIEGSEKVLNYEPFTFHQIRGSADAKIETFEMPKPDSVNFKMMADILDMANFAIAPSTYSQLQGVSRSATDSNARLESLRDSIRPLSESINESFTETINDWLIFAKTKMPPKFRLMVIDDTGKQIFETLNLQDLNGNYIFETEFESIQDVNNTVDRSQFIDFINNMKAIGTDPVTGRWLYDMEKLAKYGMDLFNKNEDFMLTKDQFYTMFEEAQVKTLEIQQNLAKLQQSAQAALGVPQGTQNQVAAPTPEQPIPGVPTTESTGGSTSSDLNANTPEAQPLDLARILKGINGG